MTCLQWVHSASFVPLCNIFNSNNKKNNNYNNQYAHAHITLYMLYSATSQRLCGTPQESGRAPKGERWALNKYERPGGVEYVAPKGSKQWRRLYSLYRDSFLIFLQQINQIITPLNLDEKALPNVLSILLVAVKLYSSPILLFTKAQLAVFLANCRSDISLVASWHNGRAGWG